MSSGDSLSMLTLTLGKSSGRASSMAWGAGFNPESAPGFAEIPRPELEDWVECTLGFKLGVRAECGETGIVGKFKTKPTTSKLGFEIRFERQTSVQTVGSPYCSLAIFQSESAWRTLYRRALGWRAPIFTPIPRNR